MAPTVDNNAKVINITNKEHFSTIQDTAGDKFIMVEFFATWCGPCRMLGVKMEELAQLYIDKAIMVKIDVDEFEDLAIQYEVTSMPAFMIIKDRKKVDHFVGSKVEQLENALEKYLGKPNAKENGTES